MNAEAGAVMFLWLTVVMACGEPEVDTDVSVPEPIQDYLSAAQLEAQTRKLTDLGPRLVGTPQEAAALALIDSEMRSAGVDTVERAPFVWDAWLPAASLVRAGEQVWDAQPFSPTPTVRGLTGILRDEPPFDGAIALMSSREGARIEQYLQASAGGARAMIRVTDDRDHDGSALLEVGHLVTGAAMPSIAVDADAGEALREIVGTAVSLDANSSVLPAFTSWNLVARVAGRDPRPVVVTAHYDSWHLSESAFDNALGVGAMLTLAAQLAQLPPPEHDVLFLATSGEEQGLQGAFAWVAEHPEIAASAVLVINLDVMWSAEGRYIVMASDDATRARALELADEEGVVDALDGGLPGIASDHFPFSLRNAPTFWAGRWPDRHYHTDADTADALNFDEAAQVLRMHWRLLVETAGVTE